MKRNAIVMVVVILTVTFMLVMGRRMARQSRAGITGGPGTIPADVRGIAAPGFELKSLDGKMVKLSDFRGKGVVLNFWATWCAPCKVEMPWLSEFQTKYAAQGLQVIGVAMDDAGEEAIGKFARETGVTYMILLGKNAVGDAYGAQFLPTTVYIDREGKMIAKVVGLVSKSEIEENIVKSLGVVAPMKATTAQ